MLEYFTAGESHGPCLTGIINGIPAGVKIDIEYINQSLKDRMKGYGRGDRMKIESDTCEILAGIRNGETIGAPIALMIKNHDFENWKGKTTEPITRPRPGHADLIGAMKYRRNDMRDILERSSARETAMRVAVGAIAKTILNEFNIDIISHVTKIGGISVNYQSYTIGQIKDNTKDSELNCISSDTENEMKKLIDKCKDNGDTVGGVFQIIVTGVPPCLGTYAYKNMKIDAIIASSLIGINAIKGVEFGIGFGYADKLGSEVHDEISYSEEKSFYHTTNNAGGIEGGMSNGENIIVNAVMKPIATLKKPLKSVDVRSKLAYEAVYERSDVCAVPAASKVAEAVVAVEILSVLINRYSGDTIEHMKTNYSNDKFDFSWLNK